MTDRYENKRVIINSHVIALFDIPVNYKEAYASLKNLLGTIIQNLKALKATKRRVKHWNDLVIYLVITRIIFSHIIHEP